MHERSAIDTLKGYFYQFDYSIIRLLELNDERNTIVVEGIEDVDIRTATEENTVQCKYYAKTEYNHSVIAEPIRLMINHYKDVKDGLKRPVNYNLYGYFQGGQEKLTLPINTAFLKDKFLTYTRDKMKYFHHVTLDLSDNDLENFLLKLSININAVDYETQLSNVIGLLQKHFNCTQFEAENFYYNNALKVIKDLAVKQNINEREIAQIDFLKKINTREVLFNEWFVKYKGKKKLLSEIRKQYFSNLNISPFERFFLVEVPNFNYSRSKLKELLFTISKKWSKTSKRESCTFCPYVYLHNISEYELIELKKELYTENFIIIDGFDFNGASFNPKSITKVPNEGNQIKLKILNNINLLDLTFNEINKTKEVYQFYKTSPFFEIKNPSIKHIVIPIEELNDIKEVI